jgi:molybdate-binding protein
VDDLRRVGSTAAAAISAASGDADLALNTVPAAAAHGLAFPIPL